jgi:hypothetical protein
MRRTASRLGIGLLVVASVLTAGCSSDGDGDGTTTSTTIASDGSTAPTADSTTTSTDGSTEPVDGGDGSLAALTAAEICASITVDAVAEATGLDVTGSEPADQSTPQCSYAYTNPSGATSNLTVASMRPEDVGDRSVSEAYEYVVDLNRSLTSGAELEEATPDAGDQAVRLSGASLHLGIVAVDDLVLTILVPAGDVEGQAADALVVAVADAVG